MSPGAENLPSPFVSTPGEFRPLITPHPGEFAHLKKNANARGLARGGWMGTAGIDCCIKGSS